VDAGFTCDTDFHRVDHRVTAAQLADLVAAEDRGRCLWAILTGGEPLLQVDAELLACLRARGYRLALETNGTLPLPGELDWVSCSPKRGVPTRIDPKSVSEVRVVLGAGQSPTVDWGRVRFVSPAHQAPPAEEIAGFHPEASDLETADLAWCIRWCLDHPEWRLSVQQHKAWGVR
jgi:organic radical activating enzyme